MVESAAMRSPLGPAAFALLVVLTPVAARGAGETPRALVGTVLPQPTPAPDFTLTDQDGRAFRMADTRGVVVVVTFLYTHCGDTCPFMAVKVREARALLGTDAERAVFVAVTTDPARDTVPVIAAYSRALGLAEGWHFLTGPREALVPVWAKYGTAVQARETGGGDDAGATPEGDDPRQGLSAEGVALAGTVARKFGGGYEVAHTAPFWVIDPRGMARVVLDPAATPREIAEDVRALMR
jgi:protein SCO1